MGGEEIMKGLSFSEPMVKAWLEGRKDLTRRLIGGIDSSYFIRERHSQDCRWLFTFMGPDVANPNGLTGVYDDKWIKPRYIPG